MEQPAFVEVSETQRPTGRIGMLSRSSVTHGKLRFIGDPVSFVRHSRPVECICPNTKEKPDCCPLHPGKELLRRQFLPPSLGHEMDPGEQRYAAWAFDRNDEGRLKVAEFGQELFDKLHEWFKTTGRNPGRLDAPCFHIVIVAKEVFKPCFGPLGRKIVESDTRAVNLAPLEEELSPKDIAAIAQRDLRIELVEMFKETKPAVIESLLMAVKMEERKRRNG